MGNLARPPNVYIWKRILYYHILFREEMPWSSVALYNKQWFSQKLTKDMH